MKKTFKFTIGLVIFLFITIPVFATNLIKDELKVGTIIYANDTVSGGGEQYLINYYNNSNHDYSTVDGQDSELHVFSLDEYNDRMWDDSYKINEKNSNGADFIGWKIVKTDYQMNEYGYVLYIDVEPYYGVKHKIITEPTTDKPTVEVSEDFDVEKYTWYEQIKNPNLYQIGFHGEKITNEKNPWTYDEKTNTYSTKENTPNNLTGKIDVTKDSKITFEYPVIRNDQNSYGYAESTVIISNDMFYKSLYSNSVEDKAVCDDKVCKVTIELSDIEPGTYNLQMNNSRNMSTGEDNYSENKVTFENTKVYVEDDKLVEGQTSKTLTSGVLGKKYYVKALYKDGVILQSVAIEYKKVEPETIKEKVEQKITDVVVNPLTGDNIVYTIIICLISLTAIVYFSKKFKKI